MKEAGTVHRFQNSKEGTHEQEGKARSPMGLPPLGICEYMKPALVKPDAVLCVQQRAALRWLRKTPCAGLRSMHVNSVGLAVQMECPAPIERRQQVLYVAQVYRLCKARKSSC